MNKISQKVSILFISIFLMSHLAIAPAIPKLYEFYHSKDSGIGLASVENIVTIPAIMITIFVILSNFFVAKLGKKNTVVLGLILIFVSGIISFLTTSFTLVLISRFILGIGIGLYNSLSISIIGDYYSGETLSSMIGLRTACLNIGKALTTFVAGYMLVFSANYTFLVYILVLPILFMFIKFVPDVKDEKKTIKKSFIFNSDVLFIMLITFLVGISYIGATIKIPTLLVTKYGYSNIFSSNILTLLAFSGIFVGAIFGKINKYLKNKSLLAMIILMIIGNFMFTLANNKYLFVVGSIFIGASFVGTMSSVFSYVAKNYHSEVNFITSMALTAGNIGVIVTPLILTKLLDKLSLELFITPFYITSLLMLCSIVFYSRLKKN